jgi:hypothetical protein
MRTSSIIRTEYNTVEVTLDLGNNTILCSKIFDKLDNLKSIFIQAKNVVEIETNFLQGKGLGVDLGIWDGKIQTIKKHTFHNFKSTYLHLDPINRVSCKRYRKVYTWQVSSIKHIIHIVEFATLGGCRSPCHTGE